MFGCTVSKMDYSPIQKYISTTLVFNNTEFDGIRNLTEDDLRELILICQKEIIKNK